VSALDGAPASEHRSPVRIVHLGLGAFHRAHQAWYTQHAGDGWGIASFTGRSPEAATRLSTQDCRYTLLTRGAQGDRVETIDSIVQAHDGADLGALRTLVSRPSTAVMTLTITEAGYFVSRSGDDFSLKAQEPSVAADLEVLRAANAQLSDVADGVLNTAPARIVVGLAARRAAGAGPLALVSCDNLPRNGRALRAAVLALAEASGPELAAWIQRNASFVDASIDRITPRTVEADREAAALLTGHADPCTVVTEPFSSWVLSGDFPAGRPAWERAGALFVEDLEPFENRKLWLLNGAHSLLAYAGLLRGHETVAQAIADPVLRERTEALWDADEAHLPAEGLDLPGYRAALVERFTNARIEHRLEQIAADGSLKLGARVAPQLRRERAEGRLPEALMFPLAAWIAWLSERLTGPEAPGDVNDPALERLREALNFEGSASTAAALRLVDPVLGADEELVRALHLFRDEACNTAPSAPAHV
jgi:fructuronate reductase